MALHTTTTRAGFEASAFWLSAVALVTIGLGIPGLRGSEDRFAEITREMVLAGDYFHPTLNGEPHFHKPLLSYWAIAAASGVVGGLGELAARLPSAVAGLLAVWATVRLASRLWQPAVGRLAGWILLTSYGFLFWSRTASADMENVAAVILAVAWFRLREDRAGVVFYTTFGLICAVGAHAKGLAAIVLPVLVLVPHLLTYGRWRDHRRPGALVVAALVAGGVYLAPFVWADVARVDAPPILESVAGGDPESGLYMVFQENVRRFYAPHDHRGPVHTYLFALPVLLLPWSLVFLAAIADCVRDRSRLDPETRWVGWAILLIFTVFTVSSSRRSYYILPILPFCALLVAALMTGATRRRFVSVALRWTTTGLLCSAAVAGAVAVAAWPVGKVYGIEVPPGLVGLTLAQVVAAWLVWNRCDRASRPSASVTIALAVILLGGYFTMQYPILDRFRTEKPFALALAEASDGLPPGRVAFARHVPALFPFYLDAEVPLPVLTDAAAVRAFVEAGDGIIVASPRTRARIEGDVGEWFEGAPEFEEPLFPWDPPDERLGAWRTGVLSTGPGG